jgi:hypothetical protein
MKTCKDCQKEFEGKGSVCPECLQIRIDKKAKEKEKKKKNKPEPEPEKIVDVTDIQVKEVIPPELQQELVDLKKENKNLKQAEKPADNKALSERPLFAPILFGKF